VPRSAGTPRRTSTAKGVLDPGVDDGLVRGIKGVLQVQEAGHKTRGQRRPNSVRCEGCGEGAFDLGPVDEASELDQRMPEVDQLTQAVDEQRIGMRRKRLGSHQDTSSNFARKLHFSTLYLANPAPGNTKIIN
jgi:hypothetical protein